jgi:hypothetical protein
MAELTGKIAPQQFETIRDQIAAILTLELAAQFALYTPAELTADPKQNVLNAPVYLERMVPVTIDETEIVNVQFAFGDFEGSSQVTTSDQSDAVHTFFIDCYSKGEASEKGSASKDSRIRLQRLVGAVRAILMSPYYIRLGFDPPSLKRRKITRLEMAEPKNDADAQASTIGRIIFDVEIPEVVELLTPGALTKSLTQVKLVDTDLGFKYEIDT